MAGLRRPRPLTSSPHYRHLLSQDPPQEVGTSLPEHRDTHRDNILRHPLPPVAAWIPPLSATLAAPPHTTTTTLCWCWIGLGRRAGRWKRLSTFLGRLYCASVKFYLPSIQNLKAWFDSKCLYCLLCCWCHPPHPSDLFNLLKRLCRREQDVEKTFYNRKS